MTEEVILTGKALWASLSRPNTKFEPKWCLDLVLEDDEVKKVKKLGIPLKEKDGEKIVKLKRNIRTRSGVEAKPPIVVDAAKKPTDVMVGNGSKVKVHITVFPYKDHNTGEEKKTSRLNAVQILELVEFTSKDDTPFDVEEGFVSKLVTDEPTEFDFD